MLTEKLKELFKKSNLTTPDELKEGVNKAYSSAAKSPKSQSLFPVGRKFAESIGYSANLLDTVPEGSVESFAGVSNVSVFAEIEESAIVLDIGCGAGLDSIIASRKTGVSGKVTGVDFSCEMIERARNSIKEANISNIEFFCSDAETIPLENESVNVILANGIFNLNPNREKIFSEMARVLCNNGVVFASELILKGPARSETVCSLNNWFA